jgi:hypothetical protein
MLSNSTLRKIALRAGISQQKIMKMYNAAIDEAVSIGKGNDDKFVLDILETYAGLNEEDISQTQSDLYSRFLESDFINFDKFLETEWAKVDEDIVSTEFTPDIRPEHMLGHSGRVGSDEDEENEEK